MTPLESLREAVEAVPDFQQSNHWELSDYVAYERALHLAWRAAYEWHVDHRDSMPTPNDDCRGEELVEAYDKWLQEQVSAESLIAQLEELSK